ncbi:hypothetical protein WI99_16910 [Burkholderia cepacia]|nr:hypothetical protein WI99_16910 [Burkholderia cepacia]
MLGDLLKLVWFTEEISLTRRRHRWTTRHPRASVSGPLQRASNGLQLDPKLIRVLDRQRVGRRLKRCDDRFKMYGSFRQYRKSLRTRPLA